MSLKKKWECKISSQSTSKQSKFGYFWTVQTRRAGVCVSTIHCDQVSKRCLGTRRYTFMSGRFANADPFSVTFFIWLWIFCWFCNWLEPAFRKLFRNSTTLINCFSSYYVYTYVICVKMLTSKVQMCIYLAVYNTLCFMMFWSLFQTIRTPIARVPDYYKVSIIGTLKIKLNPFRLMRIWTSKWKTQLRAKKDATYRTNQMKCSLRLKIGY